MTGIAIYMEGGGDGANSKAALRLGMDAFLAELKNAARAKSWRWKLVCCGSRNDAFDGFRHARAAGEHPIVMLLVDAEGPLNDLACAHLMQRDGWQLAGVQERLVHLMVQSMEAWIVSDVAALQDYYGQYFNPNLLPAHQNLELVSKLDLTNSLKRATRPTQKGEYHKIRHSSELLARISPALARKRCPNCERMFRDMANVIAERP